MHLHPHSLPLWLRTHIHFSISIHQAKLILPPSLGISIHLTLGTHQVKCYMIVLCACKIPQLVIRSINMCDWPRAWRLDSMVSRTSRSSSIRLCAGGRRGESSHLRSYRGFAPLAYGWSKLLPEELPPLPPIGGACMPERSPLMLAIGWDGREAELLACCLRTT